jgi:7 transmembrane helices usually fused to an inactive transglutaminase/Inactive transglutaminase fused to 7 transmembrane helices
MKNRHLYILAGVLSLVGICLFLYKVLVLELPLRPEAKTTNWEVEVRVTFTARDDAVKLSLFLPQNEGPLVVIDQSFLSEGYGVTTATEGVNRHAHFSIRKASGEQAIYYRFVVHRVLVDRSEKSAEEPTPQTPRFNEERMAAARGLIRDLHAKSADDETFVRLLLKVLTSPAPPERVTMLLGLAPGMARRMDVAAQTLNMAGIPARAVNGIRLADFSRNAQIVHWLEAYIDDDWKAFAGREGANNPLSQKDFPWWRGSRPLASVEGASNLKTSLTVTAAAVPALRSALAVDLAHGTNLLAYSLFTLPLGTQQVYRIILTVPIGVFFLTLLRNVVGVRTFGTFMPVLIAIAFRETHVLWGLILFTLVVSVGLLVRLYLENLRLLVVPRLSSVLIVVVLTMAAISVVSNKLGIERGLSVALFPMVIMTMTVERMSVTWDERGPAEMMRLGAGSLIVAVIAHLIMVNAYVEHICLVFPELLLVVLACNLLLGRYSGYRLLDLPRFRVLAGRRE